MNNTVKTALASTSIPVFFGKWIGDSSPPAQYFVFTKMAVPDEYHDDTQKTRKWYVYLNLYSDTDYTALLPTIRTGMAGQGFAPVDERDVSDTEYQNGAHDNYHLSMTWSILEAV